MRSQRSDVLLMLLAVLPIAVGVYLLMQWFDSGSPSLSIPAIFGATPNFALPPQVQVVIQPYLGDLTSFGGISMEMKKRIMISVALGAPSLTVLVMYVLDYFTAAPRLRHRRRTGGAAAGLGGDTTTELHPYVKSVEGEVVA